MVRRPSRERQTLQDFVQVKSFYFILFYCILFSRAADPAGLCPGQVILFCSILCCSVLFSRAADPAGLFFRVQSFYSVLRRSFLFSRVAHPVGLFPGQVILFYSIVVYSLLESGTPRRNFSGSSHSVLFYCSLFFSREWQTPQDFFLVESFYSILFCSCVYTRVADRVLLFPGQVMVLYCVVGCVLPLQSPTFSVLCCPCPHRSLLPHSVISPRTFRSPN